MLVADDGLAVRAVLWILRKRRVATEWAKSASALKKRVARDDLKPPEVVLLDLELSDSSGEESVSLVRGRFGSAKLVAIGDDLDGECAARLLGVGIPSLPKPIRPIALVELAVQLCARHGSLPEWSETPSQPENEPSGGLTRALESYSVFRVLSKQQRLILELYLCGENDKQIAQTISCSEPTVYEHWRRMGRKAGGSTKADAIRDFHRFLARN